MPKIRKDNKGRNLRPGETQRSDGNYMFVYMLGKKKKYIYDTDLAALRAKEKQLTKDADDGVRTQEAMKITLNDMFKVLMDTKLQLKASTRANYEYLWSSYIKDEPFANTPLPNIRKSDILTFYTKLLKRALQSTRWKASIIWFIPHLNWQSMMTISERTPARVFTVL